MVTPPPGQDGFAGQGFEALARLVLDIPVESFDRGAAAFDGAVRALQDLNGRLRIELEKLREELRGVTGTAADEYGGRLRAEIAAVGGAISGDGVALYRAGDSLAGAQRAMRDLAVERARVLAETPTPAVAAQFDERARRVVEGLAQTYGQLGAGLPPIPRAPSGAGGGTDIAGSDSPVRDDGPGEVRAAAPREADGAPTGDGAPVGDGVLVGDGAPAGRGANVLAVQSTPSGTGAFVVAGGPALAGLSGRPAGHLVSAAPLEGGHPVGGIADGVPLGAESVLGRAAPRSSTRPTATGDVLPPAVLRSAQVLGRTAEESVTARRLGDDVGAVRTEQQSAAVDRPTLGRERQQSETELAGAPFVPATVAAVAPGRPSSGDTGTRRAVVGRDGAASSTIAEHMILPAHAVGTALPPERTPATPPRTAAAALAHGAAATAHPVPEHVRAPDRITYTPPGTSTLASPQPPTPTPSVASRAEDGGPAGQGIPMMPPMGGMGGMGGGPAGRVEDERTRDVDLREEPGAWDEFDGALAVLGRR